MSEKMKQARDAEKLTQQDVADTVGITLMSYHRYEKGKREPGVRTAIRIADALHIPVTDEFRKVFNDSPG